MATFIPVLRADKTNKKGLAPVTVRVISGQDVAYVSLGVRIKPKDWNEAKGRVRKSEREASRINDLIAGAVAAGRSASVNRSAARDYVTAKALAGDVREWLAPAPIEPEPEEHFLTFFRRWVDGFAARGQPSTYKAYNTTCKRLTAYSKGRLAYADLSPAFLRTWGHSMRAPEPHGEGRKQNYVRKQLTTTRTAIRAAIRDGHVPESFRDPFDKLHGDPLLRTERVEKGRLTAEEVAAIASARCESGTLMEAARDGFALAFYAGGMRFGDTCLLRWTDVVRDAEGTPVKLSYRAEKTGKPTSIPLVPEARSIVERYGERRPEAVEAGGFVFPFLDGKDLSTPAKRRSAVSGRNAYANKVLKTLAKRAEIAHPERVTTHLARHSLAAHLLESGIGAHGIKEVLRHASVTTTERYLQGFSRDLLDDAYRNAFGGGGE
ncbi:tyrosine-type recombinase/integrase [Rubrivirga sp. IMCC43871]|uniref:tyrosine-type recombinase/integrase n=1 Tax=Rubrivirga sp. IMCC43871 TaxID=3391575 RepID=UPI0039902ADF